MAPDERRQAIIAATLPLLLEQGAEVSTREIAQAAGIAEGTIFRVFETKQDLIHATIHAALEPDAALATLAGLPQGQPLTERVAAIIEVIRDELRRTRSLFAHVLRPALPMPPPPPPPSASTRPMPAAGPPAGHRHWPPFNPHDSKVRLTDSVAAALEPYADELAVPVPFAAQALSALSFATSFAITGDNPLSQPHELAQVVLHGIAKGDS
jgi:AcrR family transcriptional regulator